MKDYAAFLGEQFDYKVQKLMVNAGFTCPNRDGSKGKGGCSFCANSAFNPAYCDPRLSVAEQLERGKEFFAKKYPQMKYLAYFQAYSNTYAPVEQLRSVYEEALAVDDVVGLVIATRPDCLDDKVVEYLTELSKRVFLVVELGIESTHDVTLQAINRCHNWGESQEAIKLLASCGIVVGVHLILGLPGETEAMMEQSVAAIAELPVTLIKFHQMQVLKGTKLAFQWERGDVELLQWDAGQYASLCARLIKLLPSNVIVERFVSQSPLSMLVWPRWNLKPGEFAELLKTKMNEL